MLRLQSEITEVLLHGIYVYDIITHNYMLFLLQKYGFYSINSSMLGFYELFDVSKPIESVI